MQILDLVHLMVTSVVMMVYVFDHSMFVTDMIPVAMDLMKLTVVSNYTQLLLHICNMGHQVIHHVNKL